MSVRTAELFMAIAMFLCSLGLMWTVVGDGLSIGWVAGRGRWLATSVQLLGAGTATIVNAKDARGAELREKSHVDGCGPGGEQQAQVLMGGDGRARQPTHQGR